MNKTVPIAFRVPIEVYEVLNRRASGKVNSYVKKRVIYDTLRKHGK